MLALRARETESAVPTAPATRCRVEAASGGQVLGDHGLSPRASRPCGFLPPQPHLGRNSGINKNVILNKKKATLLCLAQAAIDRLLHLLLFVFLRYLLISSSQLPSEHRLPCHFLSERFAAKCYFALERLPFQLGQTAMNTAHPVFHSNGCESFAAANNMLLVLKTELLLLFP